MAGIGPKAIFVQMRHEGEVVSIGTGVCERGWTGLYNIATAAHMRGRGVATLMLSTLAHWGLEQGAGRLYLAVMADNESANSLYNKLGFVPLYSYHYRTEPE